MLHIYSLLNSTKIIQQEYFKWSLIKLALKQLQNSVCATRNCILNAFLLLKNTGASNYPFKKVIPCNITRKSRQSFPLAFWVWHTAAKVWRSFMARVSLDLFEASPWMINGLICTNTSMNTHTKNSQKVSSFRCTSYKPPNEEKVFSSENHAANSKA